jgi:hypothetical protein
LSTLASEIRREIFPKKLKKLLIPGTAVLYFAKVLKIRDVNRVVERVVMTRATKHRGTAEAIAVFELLVPE